MISIHTLRFLGKAACFIVAGGGLCFSVRSATLGDEKSDQLRIITKKYDANRAAFKHGKCRYKYSIRSAASEEAALKEHWNDAIQHASIELLMYWSDDRLAIDTPIDNDAIRRKLKDSESLMTPVMYAKKAGFALDYDGIAANAIIHSPDNYHLNITLHPFNLSDDSDNLDPSSNIQAHGPHDFKISKNATWNSRSFLLLSMTADDCSLQINWYLDTRHGYLPHLTTFFQDDTGEPAGRMFLLSTHQEGNAYYPTHSMLIIPRTALNNTSYVEVREMKVLELDLSYEPTDEDLVVHLPKHTQYSDGVNPNTAKTLFGDQEEDFAAVSVNDLEPIYRHLQDLAKEREAEEAALAKRRDVKSEVSTPITTLVVVNAIAVGALLALFIIRRRRGRTRT